ncbi:MAG TPA: hypothetical protein VEA69_15040 [Tepidisphaeraceae bacterium]|nr:hypothetical protein [Tepidisphaeraceae bacterium]
MGDPKFAKPRVLRFFEEYFEYPAAADVFKDFQRGRWHPEILITDTRQSIRWVLGRDKDVLRTLLTTNKSFVNYRPDATAPGGRWRCGRPSRAKSTSGPGSPSPGSPNITISIVYLPDAAEGHHSRCWDWPMVLIGNAGGKLKAGRYVEYPHWGLKGHREIGNLYTTLLHVAGERRPYVGMHQALLKPVSADGPLPERLAWRGRPRRAGRCPTSANCMQHGPAVAGKACGARPPAPSLTYRWIRVARERLRSVACARPPT